MRGATSSSSWPTYRIEFDPVDVQADPAANEELKRFGIPRVPAVVFGDRAVHGWNPKGYAELLGVGYNPDVKLAPSVSIASSRRPKRWSA